MSGLTTKTFAFIILIILSIEISGQTDAVQEGVSAYLGLNISALGCIDVCNVCSECYSVCGTVPGLDASPISQCKNLAPNSTELWNCTCHNQQAATSRLLAGDQCLAINSLAASESTETASVSSLVSGLCGYLTTSVFDVIATEIPATSTEATVNSGNNRILLLDEC